MKLTVDKAIFEKFPGVRLGVVVALGVNNSKEKMFLELLRSQEEVARKKFESVEISKYPSIEPWREIYRMFGSKPSEYSSSVEALIKRVTKGKALSDINALVNLYNALSLKYVMPFGGEDLDKVKGDIKLAFAKGDEAGVYLGSDEAVTCDKDEVAYLDDLGFICRKWNWREGKRTMLTSETKNVVLVTEAVLNITDEDLHQATEELAKLIRENLGGDVTINYLSETQPSIEVDFVTGSGLSGNEGKGELSKNRGMKIVDKKLTNRIPKRIERRKLVGPAAEIEKSIERVVGKEVDFVVEHPADEGKGDWASNVAMTTFQELKNSRTQELKAIKSPRELADKLVEKLKKDKELGGVVDLSRIEVAGPGFVNFWLKKEWLVAELKQVLDRKENYGTNESGKGKLSIVEYSSPNIAKPFTIGHLRSTVIGDAIANLLEASGWRVLRDNHLGDWGTQFGKQICAIKHWGDIDKIAKSEFPVKELVALYVKFHEEAEKDPTLEDEAREWFKKLEEGDREARELWQKCIDWSWVEFAKIYELLKIKHSAEFNQGKGLGESFFEDKMEVVIAELEKKKLLGIGKEDAKLVFFEGDKLPPMMIIKKDGASLYATRDLATDKYRLEKYKPGLVVNEVGAEQSLYFRQLFEIEKMLGWYKEGQRVHVGHGMFRFKEGKMSTRKGNVIWLEEVLSEAIKRATALGRGEKNDVSQKVGIGALKWNDLKGDPKRDIVFDWDEVLNMQGNSGPYIQYTFARAGSILTKAGKTGSVESVEVSFNEDEKSVLRIIYQYPEVVVEAAKNFTPQVVATYLFGLAQKFNSFYNLNQVVGGENEKFRLELVAAVAQVLKNGLTLLGIEVPDKM